MADETQVAEPVEAVEDAAPVVADEPEAVEVSDVAEEPVELVPEAPEPMPAEISEKLPIDTPEGTRVRVEVWLAEARYFISTLEHEVGGDAGEIIAWLKARL